MTRTQNSLVAAFLGAAAITLVGNLVQYRVDEIRSCPGAVDVTCSAPDTILPLGWVRLNPLPGSELAKFHGWSEGERGLHARHGYSPLIAGVGGLVLPAALMVLATRFLRRKKSN